MSAPGSERLVKVGWARHQAEAEMLAGMLEDQGVPCLLRRAGGFDVPDYMAAGPRDILVPADQAERAREMLTGPDASPAPPAGEPRRPANVRSVALALVAIIAIAVLLGLAAAALTT